MKKARRRYCLLLIPLLAAVVSSGCVPVQEVTAPARRTDAYGAPVGTQPVRSGGRLTMGLSSEPDRLDPTTSSSLYTRYVMSSICEKLYDIDAEGRIVPQLAAALPDVSADGLTVTIPVRTGVTFADGTRFDAAAVRTSLRRHLDLPTSQRSSEMGPVSSIQAPDARTVVVRFKTPFAPLTAALADRAGMIMSPKALAAEGDDFGDHPVCVGPFKFTERVPQTSITVTRDPLYYDADDVRLDGITYRIMPDANIRAANLRSGDIQVADAISPQDVDALRKESGLTLLQSGSLGYTGVTINTGNVDGVGKPAKPIDTPIASDRRVREAFAASVDRATLANTAFNSWYETACSPIAPQSIYASEASGHCPAYDTARARRLLAEAGVRTPYRVTLQVANSQDQLRYAQALQASVAEGGFDLRIVPVEYSTLLDIQKRGTFEVLLLGWSGRIDPDANTARFLATGSPGNYGGFSSKELDDLLTRASRSTDAAERTALYGEVVRVIQRENPVVYTYRQRYLTAVSTSLAGVEVYSDGVVRLGRAAYRAAGEEG